VLAAMDLVPSLARLAGAPMPADVRLDGEDLSRAILGDPAQRAGAIRWYYPNDIEPGDPEFLTPRLAIREGRWKLLVEEDGSGAELYDLDADPRENVDLAARQPQLAERLTEQLLDWWRTLPRDAGPPRRSAP
jgi:arylsulfatase A-like enzyme